MTKKGILLLVFIGLYLLVGSVIVMLFIPNNVGAYLFGSILMMMVIFSASIIIK